MLPRVMKRAADARAPRLISPNRTRVRSVKQRLAVTTTRSRRLQTLYCSIQLDWTARRRDWALEGTPQPLAEIACSRQTVVVSSGHTAASSSQSGLARTGPHPRRCRSPSHPRPAATMTGGRKDIRARRHRGQPSPHMTRPSPQPAAELASNRNGVCRGHRDAHRIAPVAKGARVAGDR